MKINSEKEFLGIIREYKEANTSAKSMLSKKFDPDTKEWTEMENIDFTDIRVVDISLPKLSFQSCRFKGCNFIEATLEGPMFINCHFENCIFLESTFNSMSLFQDCKFQNCGFLHCVFKQPIFENVVIINSSVGCHFENFSMAKIEFTNCTLNDVSFSGNLQGVFDEDEKLRLNHCEIKSAKFEFIVFKKDTFLNCTISLSSFVNCTIGKGVFVSSNVNDNELNFIDLQTVLKSDIEANVYESVFGVHSADIKQYTKEMVSKVEFHTVFISYSFTDRDFARKLNDILLSKGIITFLWEKDSPGGQRLKRIMYNNIQKFDKVLFIASSSSLKSEACHFELSAGREKYNKTWNEVLFPIHIDDHLFNVKDFDIPRQHRTAFWDNIQELLEINSRDFSRFNDLTGSESQSLIDSLVKDLKRKK